MRKIISFCVIFLLALSAFLSLYFFFRISKITVQGAESIEGVSPYYQKLIFFVRTKEVEKEVYKANPSLGVIDASLIYPNELHIIVTQASPIAKLKLADGYMGISLQGRIVTKQRDDIENIPLQIFYYEPLYFRNFSVGDIIEIKEVSDAVFFINEVNKLAIPISKVDIQNENMILLMSKEGEIRVSSTKDSREQIAQLKTVLEHMHIQSLEFTRIDVRFDKPIVVFK